MPHLWAILAVASFLTGDQLLRDFTLKLKAHYRRIHRMMVVFGNSDSFVPGERQHAHRKGRNGPRRNCHENFAMQNLNMPHPQDANCATAENCFNSPRTPNYCLTGKYRHNNTASVTANLILKHMVALPEANQTALEADDLSAYCICLNFEKNATSDVEVMHARVLGYLILHAPPPTARCEVVREIHIRHHERNTLSRLGQFHITYFIRPFKKLNRRTAASSTRCPLFDKDKYDIMAAKFGIKKEDIDRVGSTRTECAHIIPYSTYFAVSPTGSAEKRDYSASVLAVLKSFGYAVDNLNGDEVHSLLNVMTMEKNMHDLFDCLEMWFEATTIKDCYLVRTTAISYVKPPNMVRFTSTHPDTLAVPSPELLALHAACAKVAHLSGAGEFIDKFNQDMEDLEILAPDGTSADVLCYALDGLVSQPVNGVEA